MLKKGQTRVLSRLEEQRVYKVAEAGRYGARNVVLLDFSFKLGLSVKEMAALLIEDVVAGDGTIAEQFRLSDAQGKKGGEGRVVYLSNEKVREHLAAYLHERGTDSNRYLFKSQKTVFTPNSLQQLFKRLYKEAGIKDATSHSGRSTFATRLIEAGYDIKAVSVLMGHSSVQTTARYVTDTPIQFGKMVAEL